MSYNKNILIYDDLITGHHLEYIHHLYEGACELKDINFIFAVPEKIKELNNLLVWDQSNNIKFHYIKSKHTNLKGNNLIKTIKKSVIVRDIIKRYAVKEIFFITLIGFLPMISFLLPRNVNISGIIYLIYLYRWKESSFSLKLKDSLKYLLLSRQNNFKTVFLLNDKSAPIYLNKKFNTKKFTYLPDPFIPIDEINLNDIRGEYGISNDKIVFSHIGAMTRRKGTLKILDSIDIMSESELKNKSFIFAGRIKDDIKVEFYDKYSKLKNKVQILCFDEFCEYSFLGSICLSSDFILLPYSNTSQSSGIIGYGAQFKVPVVVPNSGLLGKLVRKYNLGYTVDLSTGRIIAEFIINSKKNTDFYKQTSTFTIDHFVKNFNYEIFRKLV